MSTPSVSGVSDEKTIMPWSVDETNALIAIWSSVEVQEKLAGAVRKGKIYGEIREELAGLGYHRTVDQITNKLKKIKKEYRDHKAELSRSGAGRPKFKSGINLTLLDNVLGQRPANRIDGALNSRVAASTPATTATQLLEAMCDPYAYVDDADDAEASTSEQPPSEAEPAEPAPSPSPSQVNNTATINGSRKGKRKMQQQDLLEYMEKSDERRDRMFLEHTQQFNELFLNRMETTNNALLGLMGRIVTALEKEQSEKLVSRSQQDKDAITLLEEKTVRVEVEGTQRYATPPLRVSDMAKLQAHKEAVLRNTEPCLAKDPEQAAAYQEEIEKLDQPEEGVRVAVERCFYVDNCLRSVQSVEEAKLLVDKLYNKMDSEACTRTVHIFCDASEQEYGAVAYLRSEGPHGQVEIFLTARSRVAPKKQQSMPRLELCAALSGAQLAVLLRRELTFPLHGVDLWTDSTTVLNWIQSESFSVHWHESVSDPGTDK
ncbi:hypothetical protein ACEWY4_019328 [Coilia grayii]|uniref:Myb/SANT-like DNA-binding domain-containing protein n=2 Tax=Coilia grayii TaxID=363190 RepID=A0ABD1JFS2_9TELE